MEERIIKLESIVSMQDETINKLNEELFRQQQDAVRLRLRLEALEEKVAELDSPDEIAGNERPPHY
jgi:SlyX protein